MMQTLQNDFLKISINEIGAELSSIQCVKNKEEYLWQGNPAFWRGQSPVLFPIVGRLKNNFYHYKNKKYPLEKHGFIRNNKEIKCVHKTENKVVFELKSSPKTYGVFPFEFCFTITFELVDNKIIVHHNIENNGNKKMFFSLGGHPAFRCSLKNANIRHDETYILFENNENLKTRLVTSEGLINHKTKPILKKRKKIRIT